jgi:hypothetical protein
VVAGGARGFIQGSGEGGEGGNGWRLLALTPLMVGQG